MSPSDRDEVETLLLEALARIPSARLLVLIIAGFSGIFSGAWWLGFDARPDPWTSTQAREANAKQNAVVHRVHEGLARTEKDLWQLTVQFTELAKRYNRCEESVRQHHEEGEAWKTVIKRNTDIILANQAKAHAHPRNNSHEHEQ